MKFEQYNRSEEYLFEVSKQTPRKAYSMSGFPCGCNECWPNLEDYRNKHPNDMPYNRVTNWALNKQWRVVRSWNKKPFRKGLTRRMMKWGMW